MATEPLLPIETKTMQYTLVEPCAGYRADVLRIRVKDTEPTTFYATVISPKNQVYHLEVVFRNRDTLYQTACDCPAAKHGSYGKQSPYAVCKHIVAFLKTLSGTHGWFEQHWSNQLPKNPKYQPPTP